MSYRTKDRPPADSEAAKEPDKSGQATPEDGEGAYIECVSVVAHPFWVCPSNHVQNCSTRLVYNSRYNHVHMHNNEFLTLSV